MFTHEELVKAVREAGRDGQPFTSAAVRSCLGLNTRDRSELTRFQNRFRAFQKAAPDAIEKIGNNSYRLKQIARPLVALSAEPEPIVAAKGGNGVRTAARKNGAAKPSFSVAEPEASASAQSESAAEPTLAAKPSFFASTEASAQSASVAEPTLAAKPSFFASTEASASAQSESAAEPALAAKPSFFASTEASASEETAQAAPLDASSEADASDVVATSDRTAHAAESVEPVSTANAAPSDSAAAPKAARSDDVLTIGSQSLDSPPATGSVSTLLTAAAGAIETPEPVITDDEEEPTQPYVAQAPARTWRERRQWLGKRVAEFFGRA